MLVTAYRKLGELRENPNAQARTIRSQSRHGGIQSRGVEQVQRLGGDERITRPRAPSPEAKPPPHRYAMVAHLEGL